MKGILIVSHGNLAEGMMNTVELFYSNLKQFGFCALYSDEGPEKFEEKVKKSINEVDSGEGVIVFIDLFGGTPFNVIVKSMLDGIDVLAGFNLSMILETLSKRENDNFELSAVLESGKEAIVDGKILLMDFKNED